MVIKKLPLSACSPDTPVTALAGISEARAEAFARLGISTLADLCRHYPRAYEHRGRVTTVADVRSGEVVSLILTVSTQPQVHMIRRGMVLLRFTAFDGTGSCVITYFNQTFLKDTFQTGVCFRFYGRAERVGGRVTMSSPKYEPVPLGDEDGSTLRAIYPIYKLSGGLTQNLVAGTIEKALSVVYAPQKEIPETIPEEIRRKFALCGRHFAVTHIHFPQTEAELDAARKRLIFEELLLFALGLRLRRAKRQTETAPPMRLPAMQPFYDALPYALTGAQMRAIHDFERDMTGETEPCSDSLQKNTVAAPCFAEGEIREKSANGGFTQNNAIAAPCFAEGETREKSADGGFLMNRLLSGDVGSGKTVCAAAALYIALKNGYQAALMAPTEILARQHFADLEPLFASFGIPCALLVGSTRPKEKQRIKDALSAGTLPLVIGTHALLEDNVTFADCGLVITDEQHRFGVGQRAALAKKSEHTHVLIMSATPIPRTLALMLFGDLDMSVLDELPPGRQKVSTFAVDDTYRERLNGFIRKQVEEGRQVYIVCPAVDEQEDDLQAETLPDTGKPTLKAAITYAKTLSRQVFPDLRVAFLHGKMKPAEKDAVMAAFVAGETQILVSTTVIEVGVNVPNATLMVVENAEFFGLSQLHQLRGRVGRGNAKSWCILVSDAENETAKSRLKTLCSTNNGWEVAQKDLELRGPGDFFSSQTVGTDVRQSGGLRFELASFCDDMTMVENAFSAAALLTENDPTLSAPAHTALADALYATFGDVIY